PSPAGSRMMLRRTTARTAAPPLATIRMADPSTCWMVLPLMVTSADVARAALNPMPLQPPHFAPEPETPLLPITLSAIVPTDEPLVVERLTLIAADDAPVAVLQVT